MSWLIYPNRFILLYHCKHAFEFDIAFALFLRARDIPKYCPRVFLSTNKVSIVDSFFNWSYSYVHSYQCQDVPVKFIYYVICDDIDNVG